MNSKAIFEIALGLNSPWYISEIDFREEESEKELHLTISYKRGSYKDDQGKSKVHDHKTKKWRHLNFFEHKCYIHCDVPRIKEGEKVKLQEVPWSRANSGFTLMFEASCMLLIESEMPVSRVSKIMDETSPRLWRVFDYWMGVSYECADHSGITNLGIDETSSKKGHSYITVAVDMDERRVVHAVPGKDSETIVEIAKYLEAKGTSRDQIKGLSIDMSPAFISGVQANFKNAEIVFDRFHIKKKLNEAMDTVRKSERRLHEELKGYKYVFLKNNNKLSAKLKGERNEFLEVYPILGEAYKLKVLFDDFYEIENQEEAEGFLNYWCDIATESKIFPFIKFVNTIKKHYQGVVNWTKYKLSNGVLEGINTKIQLAKRRARGFRKTTNYINMVYLIAGKLKFNYPHNSL